MKLAKSLLLLLLALSLTGLTGAKAQTKAPNSLGYGLKISTNYSLTGLNSDKYVGAAMYSGGLFLNKKYTDRVTGMFEAAFSAVQFREQTNDTKYNTSHLDLNLSAYIYPSLYSHEFAFIIGARPSYLIAGNSEVLQNGSYSVRPLDYNLNRSGDIDFGAVMGLSLAMSDFVTFEITYNHSFTDHNTAYQVNGRPSTVELTLRLNAVSLRDKISRKERTVREQITQYNKGGGMYVMLATPNPKEVERLQSQGRQGEIDVINNEIRARNDKIIREFRNNYSTTPIYFFMDTSVNNILKRNFNGAFVNAGMKADTNSQPMDTSEFFIACFCEDISTYTNKMHYGLFVFDNNLQPLDKPFNHPSNLVSPILDGDPLNYFSKKRPNYVGAPYSRIIGKFNTRLMRYLDNP